MQPKNQSYLRRKNKESIISMLREGKQSYSDLARALKLSNTAIGKIVDELIKQNVVIRLDSVKGRQGINLCINGKLGYIISIDLSGSHFRVYASDLSGKYL